MVPVLRIWAPEAGLKVPASPSVWAAQKTLEPTATRESKAEENIGAVILEGTQ